MTPILWDYCEQRDHNRCITCWYYRWCARADAVGSARMLGFALITMAVVVAAAAVWGVM